MVPVDSSRVSRAPPYSGTCFESGSISSTRLSRCFGLLSSSFDYRPDWELYCCGPYNPRATAMARVWARSHLARHYYRNRGFFLLLEVLRWFTSLRSLVPTYVFSRTLHGFTMQGFPIRKSPDQRL